MAWTDKPGKTGKKGTDWLSAPQTWRSQHSQEWKQTAPGDSQVPESTHGGGDLVKIAVTMRQKLSDRWAKLLKEEQGTLTRKPVQDRCWGWTHLEHRECPSAKDTGQMESLPEPPVQPGMQPKPLPCRLVKKSDFWELGTSSNPKEKALENLNFSSWNICKGKDVGIRLGRIFAGHRSSTRPSVLQQMWFSLPTTTAE